MSKEKNMKMEVVLSLFWKTLERCGAQGIQFIIQIVLARILVPSDYGIIALIDIFINISSVFVQSGFNTALIQKKDIDEIDLSSVFYLSLFVASILYGILFFTSKPIATFYGIPNIVPVLRVLSITLFFGAFNSIQNAIIARGMQFKMLFFSSLGATIISGMVGIAMAYAGFGVWTLVAQQIISQMLITVILWFTVKWRPGLFFSFKRVGILFSYGWKLLVSCLIDTIYMNLRSLIIGKIYSPEALSFYNRGEQFPKIIVSNIDGSIQSVMLPALASQQDNKQRVKEMMRRSIITSSFIVFPTMIGLAAIAQPLVRVLLTDKWLPCVPFFQILSMSYVLWPIHTANLQAINALGRSDIFLKLEVIKKIIGLAILGVSIYFGVYAIAVGMLVSGIIFTVINAYPNSKLLKYSYKEQLRDIMPSLLLSLVMGGLVYQINFVRLSDYIKLIIQISLGGILYVAMAYVFKLECFRYLINSAKSLKEQRKNKGIYK